MNETHFNLESINPTLIWSDVITVANGTVQPIDDLLNKYQYVTDDHNRENYVLHFLERTKTIISSLILLHTPKGNSIKDSYPTGILLRSALYDVLRIVFLFDMVSVDPSDFWKNPRVETMMKNFQGEQLRHIFESYYKRRPDKAEILEDQMNELKTHLATEYSFCFTHSEDGGLKYCLDKPPGVNEITTKLKESKKYFCFADCVHYWEYLSKYEHSGALTPKLSWYPVETLKVFVWSLRYVLTAQRYAIQHLNNIEFPINSLDTALLTIMKVIQDHNWNKESEFKKST